MLTRLTIENFKRFRSLSLPLRPLTILTGLNGSGKTSVIHALLLARLASNEGRPATVSLQGPFGLQLGDALDVLHREALTEDGIGVAVETGDGAPASWRFGVTGDRSLHLRVNSRPAEPPACLQDGGRRFSYLCAERLGPRDVLGVDGAALEDLQVGVQGEFTAQLLARLDREKVSQGRWYPRTSELGGVITLRQQAEWWLGLIARPVFLDAEWIPGSGVTVIRYRAPGQSTERVRPTNMGFGVTFALPIVVAALLAPAGSILVVENPEAHLHPAGQSAMGAFLGRIAADGTQVVIETHSDHVINGVRRAVAVERDLRPSDVVIHYFGADGTDQPLLQELKLTSRGELSEWPPGFFDQMDHDLAALARARQKR